MSIIKHSVYKSFVDPQLGVQLWNAGLQVEMPFMWRSITGKDAQLFTNIFDPDSYYEQAAANIAFVSGEPAVFSAFQTEDVAALLPDYTLCRTGNEYMLCMGTEWKCGSETAARMPDVFAKMLLKMWEQKKIDFKKAVIILNK